MRITEEELKQWAMFFKVACSRIVNSFASMYSTAIQKLCNRVVVMEHGKLMESGSVLEVFRNYFIFSSCRMISIHGIQLLHQVGLRYEAIGCI